MPITYILILLSVAATLLSSINPSLQAFGMSRYFIEQGDYAAFAIQVVLYQFLHGGLIHLLFNSFFLYSFGTQIEQLMGKDRYYRFFLFNALFVAGALLLFSSGTTVGISGFCLALLSYGYFMLRSMNHPLAGQLLFWLVLNIVMGIDGGISLTGHLFGAIAGFLWYYFKK